MPAVCHEAASRKRPSTPTLLRWPSRWGLCGRCSHFGRTIHATHCQRCVWRHLAWTVIFGLRHAVLRQHIPRKLPFGYTFSRTMHHTSSQKGLRSGWQSGAMAAAWKRLPSARKLFYFFKYAIFRHSPEVARDIVLCFNIIYFRLVWYDMPLHIPFTILLICFKK